LRASKIRHGLIHCAFRRQTRYINNLVFLAPPRQIGASHHEKRDKDEISSRPLRRRGLGTETSRRSKKKKKAIGVLGPELQAGE